MTTIPVSVVMPAFNRAEAIERAIRSIQTQTLQPAQIVVADDASSDGTADVAEHLGATVVRNAVNQGSGPTRNAAIAAATQPWIAFLDSDDEWLPNHLETLWAFTERSSFISTSAASVRNGDVERLLGNPTAAVMRLSSPVDVLVPENPVVTSTVLLRRSLLDAAGGFRPLRRAQDMDLWIRVLQHEPGIILPDVTIRYHRGDDQAINDVALMQQNRVEILGSYTSEPWNTSRLMTRTMAARHWDAFRAELQASNRSAALRELWWFAAHPASAPALMKTLQNRRKSRNRTADYLANGPQIVVDLESRARVPREN